MGGHAYLLKRNNVFGDNFSAPGRFFNAAGLPQLGGQTTRPHHLVDGLNCCFHLQSFVRLAAIWGQALFLWRKPKLGFL